MKKMKIAVARQTSKLLFLLFIALVAKSEAQLNSGIEFISPGIGYYFKGDKLPAIRDFKYGAGFGWFRQRWKSERFFRTFDLRFDYGTGEYDDLEVKESNGMSTAPIGNYNYLGYSINWGWGIPLNKAEYEDRFMWYAVGGIGLNAGFITGTSRYELSPGDYYHHQYTDINLSANFLNAGIGFEKRMGKHWYFNMELEMTVSKFSACNLKVRFLKRKFNKFWSS